MKKTKEMESFFMSDIAVIMGSQSDWDTMKEACEVLEQFGVSYDKKIVSAHRTPDLMFVFSQNAESTGYKIIIAGAGGAAHLPGMVAALTTLPVIGVPVESKSLKGMDSLLSIVQMPGGIPVATTAIGKPGAKNAGLLAVQILATNDDGLRKKIHQYREELAKGVLESGESFE